MRSIERAGRSSSAASDTTKAPGTIGAVAPRRANSSRSALSSRRSKSGRRTSDLTARSSPLRRYASRYSRGLPVRIGTSASTPSASTPARLEGRQTPGPGAVADLEDPGVVERRPSVAAQQGVVLVEVGEDRDRGRRQAPPLQEVTQQHEALVELRAQRDGGRGGSELHVRGSSRRGRSTRSSTTVPSPRAIEPALAHAAAEMPASSDSDRSASTSVTAATTMPAL